MPLYETAKESVTMPMSLAEAFRLCSRANEAIPKSKLKSADQVARKVELRTKRSFKSFGEIVTLELSPEGGVATRIDISSKPGKLEIAGDFLGALGSQPGAVGGEVGDLRRNESNVSRVVHWLREAARE